MGALVAGAVALAPAPVRAHPAQQSVLVGQVQGRPTAPGWVGLKFREIPREAPGQTGPRVLVYAVYPGSPAEEAGLRAGDRILRLNGVRASFPIIQSLSTRIEPGDPWAFTVDRDGEVLEIPVVAVPRPSRSEIVVGTLQGQLDSLRLRIEMQLDTLNVAGLAGLPTLEVREDESSDLDDNTVRFTVFASGSADEAMRMAEQAVLVAPALAADAERRFVFERGQEAYRVRGLGQAQAERLRGVSEEEARRARSFREAATVWSGSAPFSPYPTGVDRAAGAEFRKVGPELGRYLGTTRGLLVVEVEPGTPASRAGLRSGDVVLDVDGESVDTLAEFRELISLPAERYALVVSRRGERLRIDLGH